MTCQITNDENNGNNYHQGHNQVESEWEWLFKIMAIKNKQMKQQNVIIKWLKFNKKLKI